MKAWKCLSPRFDPISYEHLIITGIIVPEILRAEHGGIKFSLPSVLLVFFTHNQTQPNPDQKNRGIKRKILFC